MFAPPVADLATLARSIDGRIGIAIVGPRGMSEIRGRDRFSMQSVCKLVVAAAALDRVDRGIVRLDTPILVKRENLSVNVQPIARLVGPHGYRTTYGDLVRRAVIESDSAANDILFAQVGGAARVSEFLGRKGMTGIRVDRDERHLQSESSGLRWRSEYTDAAIYEGAKARVSAAAKRAAFDTYRRDPRDTASPLALAAFLDKLAHGRLLKTATTRFLRRALAQCVTFPDRLKAGVPHGWLIEHKTGTSGTVEGIAAATNDVAILTSPAGETISVVVLIADSRAPYKDRAALMAKVARWVTWSSSTKMLPSSGSR